MSTKIIIPNEIIESICAKRTSTLLQLFYLNKSFAHRCHDRTFWVLYVNNLDHEQYNEFLQKIAHAGRGNLFFYLIHQNFEEKIVDELTLYLSVYAAAHAMHFGLAQRIMQLGKKITRRDWLTRGMIGGDGSDYYFGCSYISTISTNDIIFAHKLSTGQSIPLHYSDRTKIWSIGGKWIQLDKKLQEKISDNKKIKLKSNCRFLVSIIYHIFDLPWTNVSLLKEIVQNLSTLHIPNSFSFQYWVTIVALTSVNKKAQKYVLNFYDFKNLTPRMVEYCYGRITNKKILSSYFQTHGITGALLNNSFFAYSAEEVLKLHEKQSIDVIKELFIIAFINGKTKLCGLICTKYPELNYLTSKEMFFRSKVTTSNTVGVPRMWACAD